MNLVDLLIIVCLVFFVVEGMGRTFLGELLDLFSFLIAFLLSLRFYNYIGGFLESSFQIPHSVANVLGFLIFWFVTESIFFILIHFILSRSILLIKVFNKINRFAFAPAFFRGVIFVAIVLTLLASFPIQPKIKVMVNQSKIGSVILDNTHQLEGPIKNIFGGLSEDTMAFMTVKPKSDESVNLGFQTSDFAPNDSLETQMIALVNKERVQRGLSTLTYDSRPPKRSG
jgi:uncharacterized membrane protein required for colicin V production